MAATYLLYTRYSLLPTSWLQLIYCIPDIPCFLPHGCVEDRLTLVLDNSITCELYVMSKVMYQLVVKYTVYLWVSLRSFLAPLQLQLIYCIPDIPCFLPHGCNLSTVYQIFPASYLLAATYLLYTRYSLLPTSWLCRGSSHPSSR